MTFNRSKRIAGGVALMVAAALSGSGTAQADIPDGWGGGYEYDLGDIAWSQHAWVDGARGNWHTGWFTIEDDDDLYTGELTDWWCPKGVTPPTAGAQTPTRCVIRHDLWIDTDFANIPDSVFDQARNRLSVHGVLTGTETVNGVEQTRSVRVDLTIAGRGAPAVVYVPGPVLDYSELWSNVNAWGKVDGRSVKGPAIHQDGGRVGFWLDGYERIP